MPKAPVTDKAATAADEPVEAMDADDVLRPLPRPTFAPLDAKELAAAAAGTGGVLKGKTAEYRKVGVPSHRYTPLKEKWMELYTPLVEHMKLDVRMNLKTRKVELKTTKKTELQGALQKGADFVHAFVLGFDVADAIALLRLDDLYVESFEIKDVKTLRGEHLARCIGRIAGKGGKTRFTIENATRTRIVLADTHIHLLGAFANIKAARDAICALILGSPPGKVYSRLRAASARLLSS